MPVIVALLFASQAVNLAGYLSQHPPSGPWLTVDAEKIQSERANNLAAFDRKEIRAGTVTAVAPTQMVLFRDPTLEKPDLFDGLPQDTKVIALLATLDSAGWKALGKDGVGLSDLRGESRSILASLLPKTFQYRSPENPETVSLSPSQSDNVRLKLVRGVALELYSPEGSGAILNDVGHFPQVDGRLYREGDLDSAFGVKIRYVVPNQPKPSSLKTEGSAFNVRISLNGLKTVADVLATISKQTHVEVLADLRMANRPIQSSGGEARAGDILQAIALTVTGTYRPIGSAYLLCANLDGEGSLQRRVRDWIDAATVQTFGLRSSAVNNIAKSNGLRSVPIETDAFELDQTYVDHLNHPTAIGEGERFEASRLPDGLRKYIERLKETYSRIPSANTVDLDRVGLRSNTSYVFVLPDGKTIRGGSVSLDPSRQLRPAVRPTQPGAAATALSAQTIPLTAETANALHLSLTHPNEVNGAVDLLNNFGFGELWIETADPATLKAAIEKAGKPVRFVVQPWRTLPGEQVTDPDRTLLGERRVGRDQIAPTNPALNGRFQNSLALSQSAGLAGVVLLDPIPEGYQGASSRSRPAQNVDLGYSSGSRLAFFRKRGMDPIDIRQRLSTSVDLQSPFFPASDLAPVNSSPELRTIDRQWETFRAEANQVAVKSLLARLGNLSIFAQTNRISSSLLVQAVGLASLPPGTLSIEPPGTIPPGNSRITSVALTPEDSLDKSSMVRALLGRVLSRGRLIAVDLSNVPATRRIAVLDRIFKRSP